MEVLLQVLAVIDVDHDEEDVGVPAGEGLESAADTPAVRAPRGEEVEQNQLLRGCSIQDVLQNGASRDHQQHSACSSGGLSLSLGQCILCS